MGLRNFEDANIGQSNHDNRPEIEPAQLRPFENRKHWPLKGWWKSRAGMLLGNYLVFHEKDQPQLRDCELGPILGPLQGSRYGRWALRSLAAEREKARALVRHENDETIYQAHEKIRSLDLDQLDRLAGLRRNTRDLEPLNDLAIRKVILALDCDSEIRESARGRGIEIITSYKPPRSTSLHLSKRLQARGRSLRDQIDEPE